MTNTKPTTRECERCGSKSTDEGYTGVRFATFSRDGETYCEFCLEDKHDEYCND